jgi:hypothetical protein
MDILDIELHELLASRPPSAKAFTIQEAYNRLEIRVDERIAEALSATQVDNFERLFESGDVATAFRWLRRVLPAYDAIVADEMGRLVAEVGAITGNQPCGDRRESRDTNPQSLAPPTDL